MKKHYLPATVIVSVLLLLACSPATIAQNREKFVISAKAGGINAVTGQARVAGKGRSDWEQLTVTDDLNAGDTVRTAEDGRVEILLNPGSYLRIGGNSEFQLTDTSLANLEVRVVRGTAIVEATGLSGTELLINVSTPHTKLSIVREGLYRLNVTPGDATELIVRKGRVILGDSHTKVKGGNKVVFSATATSIAKLTKEEKQKSIENIELWSKDRSQTLAKANSRITQRMMTTAFADVRDWGSFYYGTRNGFWFYSPALRCFTFLPLLYARGTPYGSTYQTTMYIGGYPNGGYSTPAYSQPIISNGTTTNSVPGSPGAFGVPGGNTSAPRSAPATSPEIGNRATRKLETMTDPSRPNP